MGLFGGGGVSAGPVAQGITHRPSSPKIAKAYA
eukprot:CAMPEP_0197600186 /NCGR_PEP_ID=MMETSP1326-20131121/32802_1 /TAXON_ID=1155430 /ORGANISM="Genus nov. species nov., Strain RCC2288" /LENGTH=32 /DNA_ID= /DNA_START= /DNA_END= /DNA_ORIENTATION=